MFTQLNPPLPVLVTDKGAWLAFAVIDYGVEHNLIWVTALDGSGEIWCAPNPKVRLQANWSMGRTKDTSLQFVPEGAVPQRSRRPAQHGGGVRATRLARRERI